jgi:hypothetical protein
MSDMGLNSIVTTLKTLLQNEYERGARDALKKIVDVAQGANKATVQRKTVKAGPKQRAPRGAPRALVERVLTARGVGGASASEIGAAATSHTEKIVSGSAIRLELNRGKKERRYRVSKGKWSFAKSNKTG